MFTIRDAKITAPFRAQITSEFLLSLIECPFCLGFWTTMVIAGLHGLGPVLVLCYGFAGAPVCLFTDMLLTWFENVLSQEGRR